MASLKRKAKAPPAKERDVKKPKSTGTKTRLDAEPKPVSSVPAEGEAFRRGGADLLTPLEKKHIRAKADKDALLEEETGEQLDDLVDSDGEAIEVHEPQDLIPDKRSKKKRKLSTDHGKSKAPKLVKIDGLSYKKITKGMVILGCISKIGKRDITLDLPNNLVGFVALASISAAIRQQLVEQDENSSDDEESAKKPQKVDISKYVRIGQWLRAAVISLGDSTKKHIQLSTMAKDVNAGMKGEELAKNITVQGEVASIEDHGAILDLALSTGDIRAFVPTLELGGLKLSSLEVGSPLLCSVTSSTSNGKVVKLSANSKQLSSENAVKTTNDVNSLLPGTVIEFVVGDALDSGIRGKMMDLVDVSADLVHSGFLVGSVNQSKTGKKTRARILFKSGSENARSVAVSFLPHVLALSQPASKDLDSKASATDVLPVSSIVDEMKVTKVDSSRGLLLDVGIQKIAGFAHVSRLSDKKVKDLSASSGQWQEGSIHKGRVTGYNVVDGLFAVSLEKSTIELPFLSFEDAQPGQIVKGTVTKYKNVNGEIRGVVLQITNNTSGFVPANHLSDVQLQFPEKKFKLNSIVQARVLAVDLDRRRVTLTCKKTLLNHKGPIWSSYSNVRVGTSSPGTIATFLPSGALVQFFGNLKGFLPVSEMSESFIRDPKEHFRIGQVVNLRAVNVEPENNRLIVSARRDSEITDASSQLLERLEIGSIVSGKVTEKSLEDLVLDLEDTAIKATLPVSHLVDGSEQKCNHAAKRIRVEQTLKGLAVYVLNKNKRFIRLTNRPSLVAALEAGKMPNTFESLEVNAEVTGYVKNITTIGVFVQFANSLTGLLPKAQVAKDAIDLPEFGLHKGQTVSCRVLSVDADQQRFFLTQREPKKITEEKPTKADSSQGSHTIVNPVDGTSTDFTLGQITKAKITAVKETQLNVKLADNVQGRIDVSELFDDWAAIKNKKQPLRSFHNGQTLDVRVLGIHDARNHKFLPISSKRGNAVFELTARPHQLTSDAIKTLALNSMKEGEEHLCFVNNVAKDHVWVNINTQIRGRINAMELTDKPEEIANLAEHFPVGRALQARVIQVNAVENRLDLSARPADAARPQIFEDITIGQNIIGKISKTLEKLAIVQISENISGAIHLCDLEDDFSKANHKSLHTGQVIAAKVVGLDKEKKDVWLSKRPSILSTSAPPAVDPALDSIEDVKMYNVYRGFIKNITDQGLFVSLSRDLTAFVPVAELSDQFIKIWKDKFSLNQLVRGKVIAIKASEKQIKMSMKDSVISPEFSAPLTLNDLKIGQKYKGTVRKVEEFGVFVVLEGFRNVSGLCHRSEIADGPMPTVKDLYQEGDSVKVKVLKIDSSTKRINLGMKTSYFKDDEDESEDETEDVRIADVDADSDEEMVDDDGGVLLQSATKESNDQTSGMPTKSKTALSQSLQGLEIGGFDWTGGLDNEDADAEMLDADEDYAKPKKKRHGTAAIQIDRTGDLDAHGAQSVSDFERILMGQPNSSYLWLAYMAFHLQLSEVDKAREVAERALRTINSESKTTQDDALNVWIGYLNLENAYGDDASIDSVFKRAIVRNDPKEVYSRLTSIYIQSSKADKANTLFEEMIKKFSSDPKIWQNYASFLFTTTSEPEKARALLSRAMQALPPSQHIDIATKFAQLEFKSPSGDPERGRTIFEGLIDNFPKRLDLWNVLIDLEIKISTPTIADGEPGQTEEQKKQSREQIRSLFERVTGSNKLKVQKAKFFFKKWLGYEEKFGDGKSQDRVKARAAEFVRKAEENKGA